MSKRDGKRIVSPAFIDPTDAGMDKLCSTTWIKDTLNKVIDSDDLEIDRQGIIDASYELSDVI